MEKKSIGFFVFIPLLISVLVLTACGSGEKVQNTKHTEVFLDTFDTVIQVVGYTKTEEELNNYTKKIHDRFDELNKLYDIYNNYDGINNIKSINDSAGIKPVKVDKRIIDLILFSKKWYSSTEGKMNIAMGSVLKIWHKYREEGQNNPANAKVPEMTELKTAAQHMDIDKVIVDTENSTVYLSDPQMSLDVGGVAKGYATELVAKEIAAEGFTSGFISAGGNVRTLGNPPAGVKQSWSVGVQDPDQSGEMGETHVLDTLSVGKASVVTSGDYERYYTVNGKRYHHIIDPDTLMPGTNYRSVTVVTEDSGMADFLTKGFFLLPYEQSRKLAESMDNVEVLWVMPDKSIEATEGMKKLMQSKSASDK